MTGEANRLHVPFFRPQIGAAEKAEVMAVLDSGWLTTGPRVQRFEAGFARAVRAPHALALSSCTAALHLAVEALGLRAGQAVLVPTMTFAATAEVVRYQGGFPILVDCDPLTLNLDLDDAEAKLRALQTDRLPIPPDTPVVGIIPVHVGGLMLDPSATRAFADRHRLWVVEDAAHAFPAAWRPSADHPWQQCGEGTADVSCFSFYANKTLTTGEGGMAVTSRPELDARMRTMALHGLSRDAWSRQAGLAEWDYQIVAPGFRYNLSDVAAALGLPQLERAEAMRLERQALAQRYREAFSDLPGALGLPLDPPQRRHAWHLFPIQLRLENLRVDRNAFVAALQAEGIGFSVHWRPLHLHPFYQQQGWQAHHNPSAAAVWERLVSLPLFPGMTEAEQDRVIDVVRKEAKRGEK